MVFTREQVLARLRQQIDTGVPIIGAGAGTGISAKFEEAVFKAPIGKVTGPLASSFGWHLVFVHDRKDRRERQFDEVKDEIHGQLKDKRLRRAKSNLIKQLRGKGEIKRHIEL